MLMNLTDYWFLNRINLSLTVLSPNPQPPVDHLSGGLNSASQRVSVRRLILRQLRVTLSKGQLYSPSTGSFPPIFLLGAEVSLHHTGLLQGSVPDQESCAASWVWINQLLSTEPTSCSSLPTPQLCWNGVKTFLCKPSCEIPELE